MHEYGRTGFEGLDATGAVSLDAQATEVWQRSPFYRMLETGASLLRRRLSPDTVDEFSLLPEWYAAGLTDYVAVLTRFAAEGVIGEMDALYSSWGTKAATGFDEDQLIALERVVPYLALAIKSVSLVRMTRTLMETYLAATLVSGCSVAELCAALPSELTPLFGSVICAASHALPTPSPSRSSHC